MMVNNYDEENEEDLEGEDDGEYDDEEENEEALEGEDDAEYDDEEENEESLEGEDDGEYDDEEENEEGLEREDDGEYDDEEENEEGLEGEDDGEYDQENENNIQSVKLKKCKFRDKDTGVDCFVYELCKLFGHLGAPEYCHGAASFRVFVAKECSVDLSGYYKSVQSVYLKRHVGSRYYITSYNAARLFFLHKAMCS